MEEKGRYFRKKSHQAKTEHLVRDSFGQDGAENTCEDKPEKKAGQVGTPPLVIVELPQDEP